MKRAELGELALDRRVTYTERGLLAHSPVTKMHLHEGNMRVGELCSATITTSDNAAANLLAPLVGGLPGLQAFTKLLGNSVMRFDRMEPDLNTNVVDDPNDTTTPEAMTRLLQTALEKDHLAQSSRDQLLAWMKANTTGDNRIRAAVPEGWSVAEKTGTGDNGAADDVGVIFPEKGPPIYLTIFTDGDQRGREAHENAIAETTGTVIEQLIESAE